MLRVGIIGAGSISQKHINAYKQNPHVEITAIADLNETLAKERAEAFGIKHYYTDYKMILNDDEIDAVSIVTPTFTHCTVAVEALKAGKHVLCEKPPALTVEETKLIVDTAKEAGKQIMFGFIVRFNLRTTFLKNHIDAGNMGQLYHAEIMRLRRYNTIGGWFQDKTKSGGGELMDGTIHQIDQVMYLMGYPKVKEVMGFTTTINNDLAGKINGQRSGYASMDVNKYERTIESMSSGYVALDNGAHIYIKSGNISYSVNEGSYIDLLGKDGGARLENGELTLVSNMHTYMTESKPIIKDPVGTPFEPEINHFVDCCIHNTPCICEDWQAIELMKIIEGIYKSATTGKSVRYEED